MRHRAGRLYTASPGGPLRAYAAEGGDPVWRAELSGYQDVPFPAGATLLMVRQDGTAEGLDAATGTSRWHHSLPGIERPSYAFHDAATGLAYAFEHAADGTATLVTAIGADTGRTVWRHRLDGMLTPAGTSGGELVLTAMNSDAQITGLVRYDPGRRSAVRVALPFRMNGPEVVVAYDTAYLLERGGTLLAVGIRAGGRKPARWRLETAVGLTSAPVLGAGDRLYFSAADGRLPGRGHGARDAARSDAAPAEGGQARPRLVTARPRRARTERRGDRPGRVRVRRGRGRPRPLVRPGTGPDGKGSRVSRAWRRRGPRPGPRSSPSPRRRAGPPTPCAHGSSARTRR